MKNLFLIFLLGILSCSDGHHLDGTGSIQLIGNCKEPLPSMTTYKALGSGATADPYLIFSAAQLKSIADDRTAWDKYFEQCADIDISSISTSVIGENPLAPGGKSFSGSFNGNNFKLQNYTLTDSSGRPSGLFLSLDKATLKNINMTHAQVNITGAAGILATFIINAHLDNISIEGKINSPETSGLLAPIILSGTINHIITSGEIVSNGTQNSGGIAGLIGNIAPGLGSGNLLIENSISHVNINANRSAGGAFGTVGDDTVIRDSYATGNIVTQGLSIDDGKSGGFLGTGPGTNSIIERCYATGNVTGSIQGRDIGGFVGGIEVSGAIIRQCYATGNVLGNGPTGGFVGVMNGAGIIQDSYSTGSVGVINPPAQDGIGGFVGVMGGTGAGLDVIERSYSSGQVTGLNSNSVGGFIGRDAPSAVLTDSFAIGNVNSTNVNVGPFSGLNTFISHASNYYFSGSTCSGCDNTIGNADAILTRFYNPNTSFGFTWDNVNIWNLGAGLPTLK